MLDLTKYTTEARNERSTNLDQMSALEIVTLMNEEDRQVPLAIERELPKIGAVVERACQALKQGGRLIYTGAGTSGRLGLLDAVECPPTYGVDYETVIGVIAGGEGAFIKAREGAEDSREQGADDLKKLNLSNKDLVIGLAASGRTPYVLGALDYAKSLGCATAAIACNKDSLIGEAADIAIEPVVGPEVLTGSTRLKSGTAQKLVLNMISTATMVRLGKAYENLMVDVKVSNEKLKARAIRIVCEATGASESVATATLEDAKSAKVAIVMILNQCDVQTAQDYLASKEGHIR